MSNILHLQNKSSFILLEKKWGKKKPTLKHLRYFHKLFGDFFSFETLLRNEMLCEKIESSVLIESSCRIDENHGKSLPNMCMLLDFWFVASTVQKWKAGNCHGCI